MLEFKAPAAAAIAADVCDGDWRLGQGGEAYGEAEELAATFERGSIEMDLVFSHCLHAMQAATGGIMIIEVVGPIDI